MHRFGGIFVLVSLLCFAGQSPAPAVQNYARTPQRLARGKYLVEGLAHCFDCHSELDAKGRPVESMKGGGRVLTPDESGIPSPHFLVCPNISPDRATGAGTWTDAQFARAIREGVGHDGRVLFPMMPYWNLRNLSDEDLVSVIVYIRSIPPVRHQLPKRDLPASPVITMRPEVQPAPLPAAAPEIARRGEYLVHVGNCTGCHTTADPLNHAVPGMLFAGGRLFVRPWGTVASANLTRDPSGIAYYDEAQFIRTIRTGHVGARALSPTMPYRVFRNLSDDDLRAIFAYLRTLPPVVHRVDNTESATLCPKDKNRHGYGDRN